MKPDKRAFLEAFERIKFHWTTGALAYDAEGDECRPSSAKAETFCSLGAVYASTKDKKLKARLVRILAHDLPNVDAFGPSTPVEKIVEFNDLSSAQWHHEVVLAHWTEVGQDNGWLDAKGCPILEENEDGPVDQKQSK